MSKEVVSISLDQVGPDGQYLSDIDAKWYFDSNEEANQFSLALGQAIYGVIAQFAEVKKQQGGPVQGQGQGQVDAKEPYPGALR